MKTLTLLLALCALAAAANVPEPEEMRSADRVKYKSLSPSKNAICAPQTPCAWSVYGLDVKEVVANITNNYCRCPSGLRCLLDEDDTAINSYVHRCRPPGSEKDFPI